MVKKTKKIIWMIINYIKKYINVSSNKTDPRGQKVFPGFDYTAEGSVAIEIVKDYSMMPYINLQTLYEQAVYCEKNEIEGAFVECGVWKGGAVGVMGIANLKYGKTRRDLILFDAFDDICQPSIQLDGIQAIKDVSKYAPESIELTKSNKIEPMKGFYDSFGGHGTEETCKDLLINKIKYPTNHIKLVKGWFQDTVPNQHADIEKIAILRLDGDWFESTKVCLDYLFDKVVKGGVVIIDDYGYYEGCTNATNEFLSSRKIKTFLSYSAAGCRYLVK